MAYNPYQPTSPMMGGFGSNPYQQISNSYFYVNGIEGARQFQMAPNQTALLMDNDSPCLYVKSTNQMGQSAIKAFRLEEIKASSAPVSDDAISRLEKRIEAIEGRLKDHGGK